MVTKKQALTVAQYMASAITLSGKSNAEIAVAMGYAPERGNFVSMLRLGRAKIPINKTVAFAKCVGVDPVHFLRLTLREYSPETYEVLGPFLGTSMTQGEVAIINMLRAEAGELTIELNDAEMSLLRSAAKAAAKRAVATQKQGKDIQQKRWGDSWANNPYEMA